MAARLDIIGREFGKLVVLADAETYCSPAGNTMRSSLCRCACGKELVVLNGNLTSGHTQSCGCLKFETKNVTHGLSKNSRAYRVWLGIKKRCLNPKAHSYPNYGGRGIGVCDKWANSFEAFFSDMGECPEGLSIERKDNSGHYTPGNCIWATKKEQCRNMRSNIWVEFNGRPQILSDWAKEINIRKNTLKQRLDNGWLIKDALTIRPMANRGLA